MDRLRSFVDSVHPSSTPRSDYAALPLSNLPTPRLDGDEDGDNDFAVQPPHQRRRPTFATSWFYISQGLILLLAVLLVTEIMKDDVVRSSGHSYDVRADRQLTQSRCDAVYPGLFHEVDRAVEYWGHQGGVTLQDLDLADGSGMARAQIYNNRLYLKSFQLKQYGSRTRAVLASINNAVLTSPEPIPNVEFVLKSGDFAIPGGAPWALDRRANESSLTVMPDFGFYSWPEPGVRSFETVSDHCRAVESKLPWEGKIRKLFWRGAFMVKIREELFEIAQKYSWGAVSKLDWTNSTILNSQLVTPEGHCQYRFLAHAEGHAYSGRLKYLTQCRSVIVSHEMKFIQHFHHLFDSSPSSPKQNLVVLPGRNFDALPETMEGLLADDDRARLIATNSFEFWQHWLSPGSIDCYWRRLFRDWAKVQAFEVVLEANATDYNSFNLMGAVSWQPA